ncbi:MAG: hypothetical protein LBK59_12305 [Bifidobacteriaceae bacterium]|jgi:hypothetical protein|nr:hypothetical protein [Bifidobacteriaceae bacterium]
MAHGDRSSGHCASDHPHTFWRGLAFAAGTAATVALADHWQRGWGATGCEQARELPGDDLIPYPRAQATRAIGIAAPPIVVWPWLVQLGQGRGGFYSYDRVENLMGLDIHSADAIIPEWQHLAVGDTIALFPGDNRLEVMALTPPRTLVLFADSPFIPTTTRQDAPTFRFSWSFVLEQEGPADARLAVRERYAWDHANLTLGVRAMQWVSFVMTRKMLRGIKTRAEGTKRISGSHGNGRRTGWVGDRDVLRQRSRRHRTVPNGQ